jgi:uncharacterized protein (TIGR02145 family)
MRKIRKIFIIAALLPAVLASCNNDDDDSTSNYMTGTLSFTIDDYVGKGVTFTLTPTGITSPTTGVGYSWKPSWSDTRDTTKTTDGTGDGSWTFTTPSVVGEYTISCSAFAEDYVSSSATKTIYIVDPTIDSTITGLGFTDAPYITDNRDGKQYFTTDFGGNTWMKKNMGYDSGNTTGSVSYMNSEVMDDIFGRLYTWEEAQTACPSGWHLPSDEEFCQLADSIVADGTSYTKGENFINAAGGMMADAYFLGTKMWEYWPQVDITNKSGLSAIPIGYATARNDSYSFKGINEYAAFWTSSSYDDETALLRFIYVDKPDVYSTYMDKTFYASVRCVRD